MKNLISFLFVSAMILLIGCTGGGESATGGKDPVDYFPSIGMVVFGLLTVWMGYRFKNPKSENERKGSKILGFIFLLIFLASVWAYFNN